MRWLRRMLRVFLVLFVLLNVMAAFHAYRFTHFYDDPSLQKKKPEQMSMGEKVSAIFLGVKTPKSVNTEQPSFPYETVYLYTDDSLKLECWQAKQANAKGTVLLFHGIGSSKSKLLGESEFFYSLGYNVFLTDFRAHGGSSGNTCTIGYHEAQDVKAAYDHVGKIEKNIILWGISLGAATITRSIAQYDLHPQKIILELPFGSLHQAVKGRVRIMGLPPQPISALLTFWGGTEQGFWAFNHNPCDYARKINCRFFCNRAAKMKE